MAVVVGAGAGSVLSRSSSIFLCSLPVFLLVSLLLLSFRSAVHLGTLSLTSFLHRDPSVQSLLSRLDSAPRPTTTSLPSLQHRHPNLSPPRPRPRPRRHHHSHFLHAPSRLGTLDNKDDDDDDVFSDTGLHSFYPRRHHRASFLHSPSPSPSHNSSFLFLNDDGLLLRVKKVRVWNAHPSAAVVFAAADDYGEEDQDQAYTFGFRLLGKEGGLDLHRGDAITLVYLACLFSAAHAYAIIGFLLSYSCALGIVYVASTAFLLRKRLSVPDIVCCGSKLGIRRLPVLLFLRWSLRDALTQLLCIIFFSEIKDQYSLLKLFVKVKLMPFIMTAPPPSLQFAIDDVSPDGFLLLWTIFDTAIAIVFAMDCWVAVMERSGGRRRSGLEVIKEAYYLLSILITQAVFVKSLEMLICGILGTRAMTIIGGPAFAMALQSVIEVYFMVVWLMFYFAARCKAGEIDGRSFGWGELEESFNGCLR